MNDEIRPDVSASDTRTALDAGQADFAALLGEYLPGAALHEEPGLAWVDSGLPDSTFNYVYRASLPEADLAAGVARVKEHFQRRRLPFHWSVGLGLGGDPAYTTGTLIRYGLRFAEQEPGMGLDPRAPLGAAVAVPGLEIRPVTDTDLLRKWMWAWGCGAPDDVIERWHHVYEALPYGPHGPLRMFVGFLDGEPVATVYLHLAAGCGTVHYVVTRPEFRQRGIGAAMTELAVHQARVVGCRLAVLTASPLGVGVYRRLGFRESCLVSTYEWYPDWEFHPA